MDPARRSRPASTCCARSRSASRQPRSTRSPQQQAICVVVEASWYRWHPRIRLAQQHLPSIGRVQHVSAGFGFDGGDRLTATTGLEPARGGGALYDVGHYAVSAVLWAIDRGLPVGRLRASHAARPRAWTSRPRRCSTGTAPPRRGPSRSARHWGSGWSSPVSAARSSCATGPSRRGRTSATELLVSDGTGTERLRRHRCDAYRVMVEEVSSVIAGGPGWVLPLAESRLTAAALDLIRAAARD